MSKYQETATEDQEQKALFDWAETMEHRFPDLRWLHHIPNGGKRDPVTAAKLKAQGVKPGVSDISLPVPRGGFHGLYIELKRLKGGRVESEQMDFMEAVSRNGYCVALCKGWEAAAKTIQGYLEMEA